MVSPLSVLPSLYMAPPVVVVSVPPVRVLPVPAPRFTTELGPIDVIVALVFERLVFRLSVPPLVASRVFVFVVVGALTRRATDWVASITDWFTSDRPFWPITPEPAIVLSTLVRVALEPAL